MVSPVGVATAWRLLEPPLHGIRADARAFGGAARGRGATSGNDFRARCRRTRIVRASWPLPIAAQMTQSRFCHPTALAFPTAGGRKNSAFLRRADVVNSAKVDAARA
jgi:hypothetical protein